MLPWRSARVGNDANSRSDRRLTSEITAQTNVLSHGEIWEHAELRHVADAAADALRRFECFHRLALE
jgi:hypothetical protein